MPDKADTNIHTHTQTTHIMAVYNVAMPGGSGTFTNYIHELCPMQPAVTHTGYAVS